MPREHSYDLIASHLADWMDTTSKTLADGMREHGRAPFAADVSEAKKLPYYESMMFNPDGSDNGIGQAVLTEKMGELNFLRALAEVTQTRIDRTRHGAGDQMGDVTDG